MTHFDPLTDSSLSAPKREGRSAEELCAAAHALHMQMIGQADWLKDQLMLADERRAVDEERLRTDVQKFRETGKWPTQRKTTKRKH